MAEQDWNEVWRTIVERSWADEQFRLELLDNPNKVLTAAGIDIPAGINFVVVENEPDRLHLSPAYPPGRTVARFRSRQLGLESVQRRCCLVSEKRE